jgi:fused signal recognition particle receptor
MLKRFSEALAKTRSRLVERVEELFLGPKAVDSELVARLEEILIGADLGAAATEQLIGRLEERLGRKELADRDAVIASLKRDLRAMLERDDTAVRWQGAGPTVIMIVGVNGTGKTTTIAKLARRFQADGRSVLLAAGDTFRAAAIEQLETWGARAGVPVVRHQAGADPAAVTFDAVSAAKARDIDVVIVDTAGRLHTKSNLMEELKKIRRVADKALPGSPHDTLLVLDATTGQNALNQARQFHDAIGLTGLVLTKLDGTARGGVAVAVVQELGLPIKFIGVGEGMDDLEPFSAEAFVDALFPS